MKSSAEVDEMAAAWIVRQDAVEWSQEEQREFECWLKENTAHRVSYLRLSSTWRRADRLRSLGAPGRLSVGPRTPARTHFPVRRIAACLVLAITVGAMFHDGGDVAGSTTYRTAGNIGNAVLLADRSRVTLNIDTQLRTTLSANQRTIWLDRGEAYFDVAHDARRPFVVQAGANRITDVGTKFSVRRDGDGIKVVVLEGKVEVSPSAPDSKLSPVAASRNEIVLANAEDIVVTRQTPERISNLLEWRSGKLVLDQMTLEQAATEFNRYNRTQLVIVGPAATQLRIGGRFNVNNVEGFARLLHDGFGLKVVEEGDVIKVIG